MRTLRAGSLIAALALSATGCSGHGDGRSATPEQSESPRVVASHTPTITAYPNAEFGPQSVLILSTRGSRPVRLRLLAPDHATFRVRRAPASPAPCNVIRQADGQVPPAGMPANVTSRYTVKCPGGGAPGAVLLTKVPLGTFDYEFEVALGPKRGR